MLRSCVYFVLALSCSLFIAGFLSGDLSRSSSNAAF
uniref:Photosystem II subunit I polypeptide n=1 Tax=Symbiodinium sp. Mf1.05b TaxID=1240977 RepID=A0A0A0N2T2_9DINO|nr:photosystem II subunit I polypeptide [Symbiodinium sp. Mf1.05b]